METKQTLPELQVGSQDCPAITPAWLGARLSPDFGSLVFSLPKNQKKDFKHYSWSISAVEIMLKPWEGCAQMEHLLLECAQGPSKQCWDTTHICGVGVSPGWTANTSFPWSKGLSLLPSLFFTTRGRVQWINAAFSCLLRQEPVGIWILLQHQQHRHVGSCQDTASLWAPLCWKPQEISATLLPSKSCVSHGQCCSTGRVPSACHSARTGTMGHGREKHSV